MTLRHLASGQVASRAVLAAANHHHHDNQQRHDEGAMAPTFTHRRALSGAPKLSDFTPPELPLISGVRVRGHHRRRRAP